MDFEEETTFQCRCNLVTTQENMALTSTIRQSLRVVLTTDQFVLTFGPYTVTVNIQTRLVIARNLFRRIDRFTLHARDIPRLVAPRRMAELAATARNTFHGIALQATCDPPRRKMRNVRILCETTRDGRVELTVDHFPIRGNNHVVPSEIHVHGVRFQ